MRSAEDLAKIVGDALDDELANAGFKEFQANSKRFRVNSLYDGAIEMVSMVSRTLPREVWKIDFGIELLSKTASEWLRHHDREPSEEYRIASSRLSKLRSLDIDLVAFALDRQKIQTNARTLVNSLKEMIDTLLPRIRTFADFTSLVGEDDSIWVMTFEGRLAIDAIEKGLEPALVLARRRIEYLRKNRFAEHVLNHYENFLRIFQ